MEKREIGMNHVMINLPYRELASLRAFVRFFNKREKLRQITHIVSQRVRRNALFYAQKRSEAVQQKMKLCRSHSEKLCSYDTNRTRGRKARGRSKRIQFGKRGKRHALLPLPTSGRHKRTHRSWRNMFRLRRQSPLLS